MNITESWLRKKNACEDGIQWFLKQKETEGIAVLQALVKDDKRQWANWLVCRLMNKPDCVRYAIFAAEQVIHLYEKKYPTDKRPRKAIDAARAWLDNPSKENRAAYADAADAAYAAYAAADAADAAYAYAADAAAADAAYAAAAADAAADAAGKKLQIKIIKYGIKLLEKAES